MRGCSKETPEMTSPLLGRFFIVSRNIQRDLEKPRAEGKESILDMARAVCKRHNKKEY